MPNVSLAINSYLCNTCIDVSILHLEETMHVLLLVIGMIVGWDDEDKISQAILLTELDCLCPGYTKYQNTLHISIFLKSMIAGDALWSMIPGGPPTHLSSLNQIFLFCTRLVRTNLLVYVSLSCNFLYSTLEWIMISHGLMRTRISQTSLLFLLMNINLNYFLIINRRLSFPCKNQYSIIQPT